MKLSHRMSKRYRKIQKISARVSTSLALAVIEKTNVYFSHTFLNRIKFRGYLCFMCAFHIYKQMYEFI